MDQTQPQSVLIVEDDPVQRAATQSTLEAAGLRVKTVDTLVGAQALLAAERVDTIVIDLGLPDAFGLQAAHQIAAMQLDAPFLVLTATDNAELALAAVQLGAEDVLVKGLDDHRLVRAIQFAFKRFNRRAALEARTQYLDRIFQETPDALLVLDGQRRILRANKAAGQLYGQDPALLEGVRLAAEMPEGVPVELHVRRSGGKERRAVAISRWLTDGPSSLRLVSIRTVPIRAAPIRTGPGD